VREHPTIYDENLERRNPAIFALKKPPSLQWESVLLPLRFMDSGVAESQWDSRQRLIACIGLVLAFGFVLRKLMLPVSAPSPLYEAALSISVQWLTFGIVAIIAFKWLRLYRSELGIPYRVRLIGQ
jgi:hypothetical protein